MKKLIAIIMCVWSINAIAQEESNKSITETSFEVDGVCGMCKDRIENAAMRTSGVKVAEWDVETHMLKVVYKTSKVTEEEIHQAIAAAGHDTKMVKADSATYEKINACCRYRDPKVHEDHGRQMKSGSPHH